jgi:hypothetical protein
MLARYPIPDTRYPIPDALDRAPPGAADRDRS